MSKIFHRNIRFHELFFCPSLARRFQKRGTTNSSGNPACGTCPHGADSRPDANVSQASGNTRSSTDKSVTNPSWGDQIQEALHAQRPDHVQVNSYSTSVYPTGCSSFLLKVQRVCLSSSFALIYFTFLFFCGVENGNA